MYLLRENGKERNCPPGLLFCGSVEPRLDKLLLYKGVRRRGDKKCRLKNQEIFYAHQGLTSPIFYKQLLHAQIPKAQ